jgi:hypothetical protein
MLRWRSRTYRTLLRFHCFQITDRNLRRIHASSVCSTEGVWRKPKYPFQPRS